MTPEQASALRRPFPPETIGQLPKGGVMLDYVGHAAVTDRLLQVDPTWTWEPLALDAVGLPALDRVGNLWIKLTVCGVTRVGVGDGKNAKEVISDAIRNAAMRFGVALDLWAKEDLSADHEASAADEGLSHPERVDTVAATPAPSAAEEPPAFIDGDWPGKASLATPPPPDDGKFPPEGLPEGLTEAQSVKLDVLVGQLRDHGFITTDQLWRSVGRQPEPSEDGEVHWSPLRDTLTKDEASALIDRLQKYENEVAPGGFYIPKKP